MRFSLIIAVAVITACQPVPKPFSHGNAPPSELLNLSDGKGITVLPITDDSGAPLEQLTRPIVQALHAQNIPATYAGNSRSSFLLSGHLSNPPAPPTLVWILRSRDGDEIGSVSQPLLVVENTPPKLGQHANFRRAATALAALIQDKPPSESVTPPLYIGAVVGAPGDGNTRLRAAIEQLLPRAGLVLSPQSGPESLIVTGKVTASPAQASNQTIEIAWTVRDPFGELVGTIAQSRQITANSLDTSWGLAANEAALAGAAGIAEMVGQIDWSQGFLPPPG